MSNCHDTPAELPYASQSAAQYHVFEVCSGDDRSRLDRFLADKLRSQGLSREKIKHLIQDGKVTVDSKTTLSVRIELFLGSTVGVLVPATAVSLQKEPGEVSVLYQDAELAVLNKPAGLTVHPAPGLTSGTLVHRLLSYFPELGKLEGLRPGIVHRLDKDTSGLMLVALTERCRLALSEQFSMHKVIKEYLALVYGVPQEKGCIEAPIGRHSSVKTRMAVTPGGKSAKSSWRRLYADPLERYSLLAIRIFSGRTHQIRVHMEHIGHPLLGDAVYKDTTGRVSYPSLPATFKSISAEADSTQEETPLRQMLHAWRLAFEHPFPSQAIAAEKDSSQQDKDFLSFACPPPRDFSRCLEHFLQYPLRVVITGSPGCGKSALLEILRDGGMPVFSADAEIARLYQPGNGGHRLLQLHYGDRFVPDPGQAVDKRLLGLAMSENATLRREVEHLLHPLIWHSLDCFWQEQEENNTAMAFAEIPLYLESGHKDIDEKLPAERRPLLVGINCPFTLRKERLQRNRGWSEETVARMESWQWPEEAKMQACDLVLDNTGSTEDFRIQTVRLIDKLVGIREDHISKSLGKIQSLWNRDC